MDVFFVSKMHFDKSTPSIFLLVVLLPVPHSNHPSNYPYSLVYTYMYLNGSRLLKAFEVTQCPVTYRQLIYHL